MANCVDTILFFSSPTFVNSVSNPTPLFTLFTLVLITIVYTRLRLFTQPLFTLFTLLTLLTLFTRYYSFFCLFTQQQLRLFTLFTRYYTSFCLHSLAQPFIVIPRLTKYSLMEGSNLKLTSKNSCSLLLNLFHHKNHSSVL